MKIFIEVFWIIGWYMFIWVLFIFYEYCYCVYVNVMIVEVCVIFDVNGMYVLICIVNNKVRCIFVKDWNNVFVVVGKFCCGDE